MTSRSKNRFVVFFIMLLTFCAMRAQGTRGLQVSAGATESVVSPDSTYALIVGVSAYQYIQPLSYAHVDANEFYRYLTSGKGLAVPQQNVKLLLNGEATRNTILNNVYSFLAKNAAKAKRIIIYFSGHGDADDMGEQYLLASQCNPSGDANNYAATDAVSVNELKNKIKFFLGSGVEVLLLMDACRSAKLLKGSNVNLLDITSSIEQTAGEILFLSCEKGQVSQEGNQWGNGRGVFSYYLINGLSGDADKNKDRFVSLEEIRRFTDNALYNDPGNKTAQVPVFRYSQPSDYKLFPCGAEYNLMNASGPAEAALQTNTKGAVRSNEVGSQDANLRNFYSCISSKQFLQPEKKCAEFYLNEMIRMKSKTDMINAAQNTFAIELLDSCVRIMNLYISGVDNLGNYKYRMGNVFTNGKILFAKAKKLLTTINPEIAETNRTMELFFEGRSILEIEDVNLQKTKLSEGLRAVEEALKLKPKAAYLHHLKALLLIKTGRKEEAINCEKEALRLAPKWIYPKNTLAGIYFNDRNYTAALDFYNKAMEADSNSFLPYVGLGNTYKKLGKFVQASANYNLSIEKDSLSPAAYYNRGLFLIHRNEPDKGKKDFERCIKVDSTFYEAYLGLAVYYERKGMYTNALEEYKRAAGIEKTAAEEILSSAASLEMLGKPEVAAMYKEYYQSIRKQGF